MAETAVAEIPQKKQREVRDETAQVRALTAFSGVEGFELAQRMGKCLMVSDMIPTAYQGNLSNCIVALEMAQRLGMNPMMVMQNLYVVHGRPSWSAQFLIGCVNGCGRFSPVRFEMYGALGKDDRACVAWAYDKQNGERLESPMVSMKMAKEEGWIERKGSKWKTMPDLMLRYRAGTLFARLYAPELTMGMQTREEVIDGFDDFAARAVEADVVVEQAAAPDQKPATEKAAEVRAQVAARRGRKPAAAPAPAPAAAAAEEPDPERAKDEQLRRNNRELEKQGRDAIRLAWLDGLAITDGDDMEAAVAAALGGKSADYICAMNEAEYVAFKRKVDDQIDAFLQKREEAQDAAAAAGAGGKEAARRRIEQKAKVFGVSPEEVERRLSWLATMPGDFRDIWADMVDKSDEEVACMPAVEYEAARKQFNAKIGE